MKRVITVFLLFLSWQLLGQEVLNIQLNDIVADISKYKNSTITMKLKLKLLDNTFEKIVFYDKKNHDIEFDISSKKVKRRLKRNMLNLHEGLDYNVTFKVIDVGNLGLVVGDLMKFSPSLFDALPEN